MITVRRVNWTEFVVGQRSDGGGYQGQQNRHSTSIPFGGYETRRPVEVPPSFASEGYGDQFQSQTAPRAYETPHVRHPDGGQFGQQQWNQQMMEWQQLGE